MLKILQILASILLIKFILIEKKSVIITVSFRKILVTVQSSEH